jgi:putative selenate reductase FAD-binding subunit
MVTDVLRPTTVAEAVRAGSAPGAAWLGGGTWLNSGAAPPVTTLVSLEQLGLDRIRVERDRCRIGSAATFQVIADDPHVPGVLREAVRLTASRTLRNMVTLGGELGLAPKDSAVIPVLILLEAEVSLAGHRKPMPIRAALQQHRRLILEVIVPRERLAAVRAVSRTSHSPRSLVVAVSGEHVVVSDCQGQVQHLGDGRTFDPRPDLHASAAYKRHVMEALVQELKASLPREHPR